ncbi:hypothetical protein POTOM_042049 [Populus tomentosa]|uniref:Uncharacterized protein n=1 Tax=Populus tomentosa TaxID=118781 RepID=A0A8X8C9N9_POPTO|nr:hypothetical protein POTOM_042049 [Populus tomentosa]
MGSLLKNYSSITSHYRSQSQKTQGAFSLSRRGFHVEPGPREQAIQSVEQVQSFRCLAVANNFLPPAEPCDFGLNACSNLWKQRWIIDLTNTTATVQELNELSQNPSTKDGALLAEDPSLKRFKSHKKSVWRLKRFGDVLTLVVVAGCCYEIYVKTVMREEARKQAKESA